MTVRYKLYRVGIYINHEIEVSGEPEAAKAEFKRMIPLWDEHEKIIMSEIEKRKPQKRAKAISK